MHACDEMMTWVPCPQVRMQDPAKHGAYDDLCTLSLDSYVIPVKLGFMTIWVLNPSGLNLC